MPNDENLPPPNLLDELKRRKVVRVGAAYLVVGWLAVQAASIGFPAFDAPPWALRVFILVALLGFPVAVVLAWALDLTPDGVKVVAGGAGTKRVVAGAAVLLGLAVGWFVLGQPAVRKGEAVVPEAAVAAPAPAPSRKSIAVLPFTDLSPAHDQEYFSDGIAEEILNALAKLGDLKVAGRTSSFHFKGKNEDLRAVGKALGVATILEGSVRKQGERVRITAQLIQTEDGFHLWSETYDGKLEDVFELQERIARAITAELKVVLQGGEAQRLVPVSTANPDAYALYLQATATFNRRDGKRWPDAIAALEQAVKLDPSFARAHARLAALNVLASAYDPARRDTSLAEAEDHAAKATALDPKLAEPYASLGAALTMRRRFVEGRQTFERALALDPDDVTTNFWNGTTLSVTGYRRLGNAAFDRVLALDPLMPNGLSWRAQGHMDAGELDPAEVQLRRAADLGLAHASLGLSRLEEARGRRDEARIRLAEGLRPLSGDFPPGAADLIAGGVYGDEAARREAVRSVEAYVAAHSTLAGLAPYALLRLREPARALEVLAGRPCANEALVFGALFGPYGREVRALPAFPAFARKEGFAALWDRYGAPDLCRRDGAEWRCDLDARRE